MRRAQGPKIRILADHSFCAAQVALHDSNALRAADIRAEHTRRGGQRNPVGRRHDMGFLDGRVTLSPMGDLWLYGGIYQGHPMAQPDALVSWRPVFDSISGDSVVLLVAAGINR